MLPPFTFQHLYIVSNAWVHTAPSYLKTISIVNSILLSSNYCETICTGRTPDINYFMAVPRHLTHHHPTSSEHLVLSRAVITSSSSCYSVALMQVNTAPDTAFARKLRHDTSQSAQGSGSGAGVGEWTRCCWALRHNLD